MDGRENHFDSQDVAGQLLSRLSGAGEGRLSDAAGRIVAQVFSVMEDLCPDEAELDAFMQFLTDVGYATDARRQEWVLLADVFGLSAHVSDRCRATEAGATPATLRGPFYRASAPFRQNGDNLSAAAGPYLAVSLQVCDVDGAPIAGAEVEVWHANGCGRYEDQDPDNQPEHNLRGRLCTDDTGRCSFLTERPRGYSLPNDGPVGLLAKRLGLSLDRPAHIHCAATAPGFNRLVTAFFDGSDPAIDRDPLFAVKPGLVADFHAVPAGSRRDGVATTLDVTLALSRDLHPSHTATPRARSAADTQNAANTTVAAAPVQLTKG